MKRMVLVQQQISQKQLQILRCLMDVVFQVILVGPDEGIAEVPGILRKNVIGHIKAERPKILDEEHRCCSGIALPEYVNLPQPRNENRKVMDDLYLMVVFDTSPICTSCPETA